MAKHRCEILRLGHARVQIGEGRHREDDRVGAGAEATKPVTDSEPKCDPRFNVSPPAVDAIWMLSFAL